MTQGWTKIELAAPPAGSGLSKPLAPSARHYHAATRVDILDGGAGAGAGGGGGGGGGSQGQPKSRFVMFSGANCTGRCLCHNDTWVFDPEERTWTEVATTNTPSTRYHATMVALDGVLYVFGGESYNPIYMYHNSVLRLDIQSISPDYQSWAGVVLLLALLSTIALLTCIIRSRSSSSKKVDKKKNE